VTLSFCANVHVNNIVCLLLACVSLMCGYVGDGWCVLPCVQAMSSVCDRSAEFASKLRKSASLDGMLSADQDAAVLN